MTVKGIFIEALPNNGPAGDYSAQNKKILEDLRETYDIITYHSLEHAAYQMTHDDAEQCSAASFMITNIPYAVQAPVIASIKAEGIKRRLENLIGEARESELRKIADENEFSAYSEAFECLKKLRAAFPDMKIIAYTSAHEKVRRKIYDEGLVFRVHQRGHRSGLVWERANLVHGVERALAGWRGCE